MILAERKEGRKEVNQQEDSCKTSKKVNILSKKSKQASEHQAKQSRAGNEPKKSKQERADTNQSRATKQTQHENHKSFFFLPTFALQFTLFIK